MALTLSDLSYDLLTLVRTYDRANDFERAEEYRLLLDRVEEQEESYDEMFDKFDDLEGELFDANTERHNLAADLAEAERQRDINARLLRTIAGIAREALDDAESASPSRDVEGDLLEALSAILSHAEA